MTRRAPLPGPDAIGLLAAVLETPVLGWAVPASVFAPGPERALFQVIVGCYAHLEREARATGSYEQALFTICDRYGYAEAAAMARRVIDGVRTLPELLGPGRARLKAYAAPRGLLMDEEPAALDDEPADPWLDEAPHAA